MYILVYESADQHKLKPLNESIVGIYPTWSDALANAYTITGDGDLWYINILYWQGDCKDRVFVARLSFIRLEDGSHSITSNRKDYTFTVTSTDKCPF